MPKESSQNIEGRAPTGPPAGFGQLWEKVYTTRLRIDATPEQVMDTWKREFPSFWPPKHDYFPSFVGIEPGEVNAINIPGPGGTRLSTGVLVLHSDVRSFTLSTAKGHMFAGWITFSVEGVPRDLVAEIRVLMRATDPIYELGMRFGGGHAREDKFWSYALRKVARRFDQPGDVQIGRFLRDRRMNWGAAGNIWYNAWIRTNLDRAARPFRSLAARLRP